MDRHFSAMLALSVRFARIFAAPGVQASSVLSVALSRFPSPGTPEKLVEALRTWAEFYEETLPDIGPAVMTGEELRRMAGALRPDDPIAELLRLAGDELDAPGVLVEPSLPLDFYETPAHAGDELSAAFRGVRFDSVPPPADVPLVDEQLLPEPLRLAAREQAEQAARRFVQARGRSFDPDADLDRGWAVEAFACSEVAAEAMSRRLGVEPAEDVFLRRFAEATVEAMQCTECKGGLSLRTSTAREGFFPYCRACENARLWAAGREAGKP